MCLTNVYRGKEKKEFLDKLPDEIVVWKVVAKYKDRYSTDCRRFPLHSGRMDFKQNIIKTDDITYRGGGHFFLHRADAEMWGYGFANRIVRCKIKKEWINTVGTQDDAVVLVAKRAVFPEYIGGV